MSDVMRLADLATPWSIRVAVTLRIPELIEAGTCDVTALAEAVGCDRERLWGLLVHLAGRGVFTSAPGARFEMNEAGRQLLDPNVRRFLDLDGIGGRFAGIWSTMLEFVRTGDTQYPSLFGRPFWEDLAAYPHLGEDFDALMAEAHGDEGRVPPITTGWDTVRWVVDVGGGKGHVVAHVLRTNRALRATVVDLPATAARAAGALAAAGLADRTEAVGQSFFDPLPAGADVYLLVGILNDWPDAEAAAILARCAEAATPDRRVVIAGGVRSDDAPPKNEIDKLVTGGRDRPLSEFRSMAAGVGLELVAVSERAIECVPVATSVDGGGVQ